MKAPQPHRQWPRLLLANLFIVVAYVATRQLGGLLDLPPGYALPCSPGAGAGLALAFTFGARALPGVALGALALYLPAGWPLGPAPAAWLAALAAACGAVLQAWLGARLLRRWVSSAIGSGTDVLRFLLLTPLSCLAGATVAVPAMDALGLVAPGDGVVGWLSWWVGDTVGVLLVAPLVWIGWGRPRPLWRRRARLLALPLLAAAFAVAATYQLTRRWENDQQLHAFRLKAQQVADLMQSEFTEHERFVETLSRALSDTQALLSQKKFLHIVSGYVEGRDDLRAVNWGVRVSHAERAAFEAWARQEVEPGYEIRDLGPHGLPVRAAERDDYMPLLYTLPRGNRVALGFDFLADPARSAAAARATASGRPEASEPLQFLAGAELRQGIALFKSVYPGTSRSGPSARVGQLVMVLDTELFVKRAFERAGVRGALAELADLSAGAAPQQLYGQPGLVRDKEAFRATLGFGGRRYLVRTAPAAGDVERGGWASWTVLAAGLGMTSLLGALMLLTSGERARIEALVRDRTARLRDREARMQAILDNAADAIITVDRDGVLVSANAATAALFRYPPERLPGLQLASLVPAASDESAPGLLERLVHAGRDARELAGIDRQGRRFPLSASVSRVLLPHEHLYVCVLHDLTEQQRSQEHIYQLAHHDTLTGLENRFALNLRLEQQLAHARRHGEQVAVLFIDLDHFKKVNDSHGHQAGDQLLVTAAQRMRELLRDVDALGRIGGDEFIIVLGGPLSPDRVSTVAVRVVHTLSNPYQLDAATVHSGASVGVALYPDDGADRETLLRHADMAMYAAKREGRANFQFFSPAMNAATHEHLMIENRMWLALEQSRFELHLQAQVAVDSGRVIGAEALLRWHDPELGQVEPGRFIPIAEESGLILPLGDWVLARAMQQLADWQRDGLGKLRLAVNLSARQFSSALPVRLDQLLAQHRIDPGRLELEITETAAMRDPENTRALLRQLRARGFKLAIDDFGTGYSSLAYLKLFAIDRIKIDRAFVQDLETNPNDAVIVAATIGMAHSLGLGVVAEGVETRAQWRFLREKHGDEAQGYLFGRPMPAGAFRDFIREAALPLPGPHGA